MDRTKVLLLLLVLLGVGFGGYAGWMYAREQRERGVREAVVAYQMALIREDPAAFQAALTPEAGREFSEQGGQAFLPMIKSLSPSDARVGDIRFPSGSEAEATLWSAQGKGTARVHRVAGAWKIRKVSWTMNLETVGLAQGKPLVMEQVPVPPSVQPLLTRMAGHDPVDAGKAWLELGGKYDRPSLFRRDLAQAFADARPIPFRVVFEESTTSAGTFRYYTTKLEPLQAGSSEAATVGEALRLDLWRMEGLGLRAGSPDPVNWWKAYAQRHGLQP